MYHSTKAGNGSDYVVTGGIPILMYRYLPLCDLLQLHRWLCLHWTGDPPKGYPERVWGFQGLLHACGLGGFPYRTQKRARLPLHSGRSLMYAPPFFLGVGGQD